LIFFFTVCIGAAMKNLIWPLMDKVVIKGEFAKFPDGGSHLDQGTIIGQQKQLQIDIKNSLYQKIR
jgi:hypothetical protein